MAPKLPPVNATLTRVFGLDYVNVGGEMIETEVEKWAGTAPAFTTEKNSIEAGPGGLMNVYAATVALPSPLGSPPVAVEVGDLLEYERSGETQTRRVDQTEDRADFGFTRCFVSEQE